jgi:hypothetical protein
MGSVSLEEKIIPQQKNSEVLETKSIFIVAKLRVQSSITINDDFEMFKLHWKRQVREALLTVGEVKIVDILT